MFINPKTDKNEPIIKLIYCYGVWQSLFDTMEKELDFIEFHQGILTRQEIDELANGDHVGIVLDDVMTEAIQDKTTADLFTQLSHHMNISVFYLTQNLYQQAKYSRLIRSNTKYFVLFKFPGAVYQLKILGSQSQLSPHLIDAYTDCMQNAHGYLILDLTVHCPEKYRMRTNIFPNQDTIIYTKK
jgi:hypothetical protein